MASGSAPGTASLRSVGFHLGKLALYSGSEVQPLQMSSVGVPRYLSEDIISAKREDSSEGRNLKIRKSWSISESPGKRGRFVIISAKMQPALHTSTATEYCCEPNKISGARYHSVITCRGRRFNRGKPKRGWRKGAQN